MAPDPALALATLAALDQVTNLGPAAVREAALAPGREIQPVLAPVLAGAGTALEAAGPVLVLATLLERAPAINPAEVVGTKSRIGGA